MKPTKDDSYVGFSTYAIELSIPFECRSVFKLSAETGLDRWCKGVGLAKEIQTGDASFDQHIYIACDSSAFAQEISQDKMTRDYVMEFFADGCENIRCDGETLLLRYAGDRIGESVFAERAIDFFKQMNDMERNWRGHFFDPFILKAIAVEGIIWSAASYALFTFFTWTVVKEDIHLDPYAIFAPGIIWGLGVACLLLFFIAFFMSGSSRGHRIIAESILVLGLSVPVFGISLYSDVNMQLDKSPPKWIEREVYDKQQQKHRSRSGTSYSYHLYLDDCGSPECPLGYGNSFGHAGFSKWIDQQVLADNSDCNGTSHFVNCKSFVGNAEEAPEIEISSNGAIVYRK